MFQISRIKARTSVTTLMLALLTGCNIASDDGNVSSGNNSTKPNPPSGDTSILSAENTVNLSRNMSTSYVSLEGKIHSPSQNSSNIVSAVHPATEIESCKDVSFDSNGYTVTFDDFVGVCVYEYDVENLNDPAQKASAYAISIAQKSVDSEASFFTPMSYTTLVGEPLTIELKKDPNFVTQVPEGYTMDQEITLIGVGEATVDNENQTITYKPTEDGGFAKVIFSYSNGSEVKLGDIAISVSSFPNTAPNAPDIDYSDNTDGDKVYVNQEVIIDLAKSVSDDDGDALQLIYTDSWNAAVSPLHPEPEDMNNLKLRFKTTKVGEHFVSYAISDHYGGYATGMIRIEVYDPEAPPSWGNLKLDMNYYFAPLTKPEADAQGIAYTSSHIDSEAHNANVATFNLKQAKDLCAASGRLPTPDELIALSGIADIGPSKFDNWPVQVNYWAFNSGSASTVSLASGQASEIPDAGGQYVTCVAEGGYRIDKAMSKLEAIGNGKDEARIEVQATLNGAPLKGITVEASVTGSAKLINETLTTDENGQTSFKVVDALSEEVNFTTNITESEFRPTVQLQFTGDPDTAELQLKAITDNQPPNATNVFKSILKDANGSPVGGKVIDYSDYQDVVLYPNQDKTDDKGEQLVAVAMKEDTAANSYSYVVHAEYQRPNGSVTFADLPMTFSSPNHLYGELEQVANGGVAGKDANGAAARFDVYTDPEDNKITMTIEGPAIFATSKTKSITVRADKQGRAVAPIFPENQSITAPIGYSITASYHDQKTKPLGQYFMPNKAPSGQPYETLNYRWYQIRTGENPPGYYCPPDVQYDQVWFNPGHDEFMDAVLGEHANILSSLGWNVQVHTFDGVTQYTFGELSQHNSGQNPRVDSIYTGVGSDRLLFGVSSRGGVGAPIPLDYKICSKPK